MATKPKQAEQTAQAFKGFDKDLKCRGYQFAIGETFKHDGKVEVCGSGFHSCEYPLDIFSYYPPAGSRFAVVRAHGEISRKDGGDSKIASGSLTIEAEIGIPQLVARAIEWITSRCDPAISNSATGDQGAASATGYQGAASATGYQGAASATGDQGAASATGYQGAASATGDQGAASATGDQGAASATGDQGAASATGDQGAASATGTRGAASATGYQGAASATGTRGAASATGTRGAASATGDQGAASATGAGSVALASGWYGKARALEGGAIFLANRDGDGNIRHVAARKVGEDGIKPETFYTLNDSGEVVEAEEG